MRRRLRPFRGARARFLPLTSLTLSYTALLTSAPRDPSVTLPFLYPSSSCAFKSKKIRLRYSPIPLDLDTLPFTIPAQALKAEDMTKEAAMEHADG